VWSPFVGFFLGISLVLGFDLVSSFDAWLKTHSCALYWVVWCIMHRGCIEKRMPLMGSFLRGSFIWPWHLVCVVDVSGEHCLKRTQRLGIHSSDLLQVQDGLSILRKGNFDFDIER
jgi:hypothetical protein